MMDPLTIAALALKGFQVINEVVALGATVQQIRGIATKYGALLERLQAEKRNPTEAEWAEVDAATDALHAEVQRPKPSGT